MNISIADIHVHAVRDFSSDKPSVKAFKAWTLRASVRRS